MVHFCKMMIYLVAFFSFYFFKILIFWVVSGVKGQNMAQNDKKFCLLHSVCQESYHLWLWFLEHMCKMISPAIFFIFSKFWFFRLWVDVVKGQKMTHNYQFQSHWNVTLDNISCCFSLFFKKMQLKY